MGASACSPPPLSDCKSKCCTGAGIVGLALGSAAPAPAEYEPTKGEAKREHLELGLGAASSERDDPTEEAARELEELRQLPPGSAPDGPRPLYRFATGATYLGEWRGNERHGMGCQQWPDGAKYVGLWSRSRAEGHGQREHADGDIYVGQWVAGVAQGLGIYYDHKGSAAYRGRWFGDVQDGPGEERFRDGARYVGQHVDGRKEGHGVFRWPDASEYSGQWVNNSINGFGHYLGHDGREFYGMWREAKIHGCGMYLWPDGRKYCGQYVNDQKHGFGIFQWQDGRRYLGFWHEGKQHGPGKVCDCRGREVQVGIWKLGVPPSGSMPAEDLGDSPVQESGADSSPQV